MIEFLAGAAVGGTAGISAAFWFSRERALAAKATIERLQRVGRTLEQAKNRADMDMLSAESDRDRWQASAENLSRTVEDMRPLYETGKARQAALDKQNAKAKAARAAARVAA